MFSGFNKLSLRNLLPLPKTFIDGIGSFRNKSEIFKDKISDEDKEAVKPLVDKVKEAVNTRIKDDVDSAMKELDKVWAPIAQKLYPPQENPGQQFNFDPSQFGGSSGPGNPFTSNN